MSTLLIDEPVASGNGCVLYLVKGLQSLSPKQYIKSQLKFPNCFVIKFLFFAPSLTNNDSSFLTTISKKRKWTLQGYVFEYLISLKVDRKKCVTLCYIYISEILHLLTVVVRFNNKLMSLKISLD